MKILHFKDVTSTNDMAKSLVKVGETDILITADYQSRGRGKQNSVWFGEREKNLYLSFTLPLKNIKDLSHYSIISCVGVNRVLRKYGFETRIKPINDIYIKDKKLCGILCETEFYNKVPYIIVGVGINVYTKEFPEDLNATSLVLENENIKIDIKAFGEEIANSVRQVYKEDFENIKKEFEGE